MKINLKIKKLFYIYLLTFFGFLCISYYIWFRFIRERAQKNIPFELTSFSFLCLCLICLLYIIIIYRIYIPRTSNSILYLFHNQFQTLLKPFYFFDKIFNKYNTLLFKFYFHVILYLNLYKTKNNKYFCLLCNFMPRVILLLFFFLDIFYFHKLYLCYNMIFLSIIPLFYNYSIHAITQYLDLISNYLDKHYHVEILSTKKNEEEYEDNNEGMCFFVSLSDLKYNDDHVLEAKYFIDCQALNLEWEKQLYKYTCIETWLARDQYIKKHKLEYPEIWIYKPESDEISKALVGKFKELMPQAYYFKTFLEEYNYYIKKWLIIYNKYFIIGYAILWMYILIISFHTLNLLELVDILHSTLKNIQEPFSGCMLFQACILYNKNNSNKIRSQKHHNNNTTSVYKSVSITQNDIHNALIEDDLDRKKTIKKFFEKYKQIKKQLNEKRLHEVLKEMEKTQDKKTFEELMQKVTEYENKFK